MNWKSISLFLATAVLIASCGNKNKLATIEINSNWQFKKVNDTAWLPATVPGCVHTDLIANKKIEDPFWRKNEQKVKWIENEDWEYKTTFSVPAAVSAKDNIDLVFEGLDTYASVRLNDSLILNADNMYLSWNIPVKKYLKEGKNELKIYFTSAVNEGMKKLKKLPYILMAANEIAPENERSNVFTRKAPFHYGWDWGPRLVTCGVWRPIKINGWNKAQITDLFVEAKNISTEKAEYKAHISLQSDQKQSIQLKLSIDGKETDKKITTEVQTGKNIVDVNFQIDKPELWWTNGLGGHKLYNVEVILLSDNNIIHSKTQKIGVRTVEVVRTKDSIGTSFYFKLNGIPVFMKGSDYIPSDVHTTKVTPEIYKRLIKDAVVTHMNMLRVWGGAIYENDIFYDLCDENGILVWQDFMFACNLQPDDSLHLDNIRKEAEQNVIRLRNHPSMAIWCGNNENLRAWEEWGWNKKYSKKDAAVIWSVYEKIFHKILPDAVHTFSPGVFYWASSPQADEGIRSDRKSGDEHDWTVWFGDVPFTTYAWMIPRFISEYGLQSFPEMKTLKAFAIDSDMQYRSPVMEHRQRSQMPWIGPTVNGNEMIKRYILKYYKEPKNFESFVYLSQLTQAEGMKYAVETHRSHMPYCMGSLYWQINDAWPTMSWSSIDYFGRWKASHYFIKKVYEPILVVPVADKDKVDIYIVSDKLEKVKGSLVLKLIDFKGKIFMEKTVPVDISANTSKVYFSESIKNVIKDLNKLNMCLITEVQVESKMVSKNILYFTEFKNLELPSDPQITKMIKKENNDYVIDLVSDVLAKNVYLTSDNEGFFSDNYFDILPGEKIQIRFSTKESADFEKSLRITSLVDTY